MNGIVVKTTGKKYKVKILSGDVIDCRLRGRFRLSNSKSTNPIVVGDLVKLEKDSVDWMITKLFDRKNQILRKSVNLSKQIHIIASNIDQAILIITLEKPVTTTSFIDRFLVSAASYSIKVVLLFNKLDIYNNELLKKQRLMADLYRKIGYDIIEISVLNDDLSLVREQMRDKINIVSGHSGVGKSTLINKLQPNLNIDTKEVSDTHQQGQHTTTFSELYDLDFGASIIDTPGIRGFGLFGIEKRDIGSLFPEFILLKSGCRFYNCAHQNEPDCAVKIALEKGDIALSRYTNYLSMVREEGGAYRKNDY